MSDSPDPADMLREELEGLKRRVRLLETSGPRVVPGPAAAFTIPAGRDWVAYARHNAWSLVYLFIGFVDLAFGLRTKDPILICGAAAMMAFAWLSWRGEP